MVRGGSLVVCLRRGSSRVGSPGVDTSPGPPGESSFFGVSPRLV